MYSPVCLFLLLLLLFVQMPENWQFKKYFFIRSELGRNCKLYHVFLKIFLFDFISSFFLYLVIYLFIYAMLPSTVITFVFFLGASLIPYGLPCLRELFRFLISLTNPHDRHNTDAMMHMGLQLLNVALESAHFVNYQSLLGLIKDELCRHLFQVKYRRT